MMKRLRIFLGPVSLYDGEVGGSFEDNERLNILGPDVGDDDKLHNRVRRIKGTPRVLCKPLIIPAIETEERRKVVEKVKQKMGTMTAKEYIRKEYEKKNPV